MFMLGVTRWLESCIWMLSFLPWWLQVLLRKGECAMPPFPWPQPFRLLLSGFQLCLLLLKPFHKLSSDFLVIISNGPSLLDFLGYLIHWFSGYLLIIHYGVEVGIDWVHLIFYKKGKTLPPPTPKNKNQTKPTKMSNKQTNKHQSKLNNNKNQTWFLTSNILSPRYLDI